MFIKPVQAFDLETFYKPGASIGGNGAKISNVLSPIISNTIIVSGLVSFFVILFAGFMYISGAGDKAKLTQATNMLNYGILGLVIVAAAYLVTTILGTVLGFKLI